MEDYLRKAVELAKGWELVVQRDGLERMDNPVCAGFPIKVDDLDNVWLDALAAQLVRQVDEAGEGNWKYGVTVDPHGTYIVYDGEIVHSSGSPDRTLNTIKAIVDSGVLEQLQKPKAPCDHTGPIGIYVKNGTKHCVECFQPLYDCLDCGKRIIQSGTPIPGTDVLGYYRYCEKCRDADDQLQEREA